MTKEPDVFVRGKAFHKLIQKEWEDEVKTKTDDKPYCEKTITKHSGSSGRMDIFIDNDDPDSSVAVVEIKSTDWEKVKKENINRYMKRQIKQVWDYIESQIYNGRYTENGARKDVCPGIIFPRAPLNLELKKRIETEFEDYGIIVVWHNEK